MKNPLSLIKSSFHDIRCCDEGKTTQTNPETGDVAAWRALSSSVSCVLDGNGTRTGYAHVQTLEQYSVLDNGATGVTKLNTPSDVNYIPDYPDSINCSVVVATNIVELFSSSGGLNSVHLTKGTDVYDLVNDLDYSKRTVNPGSYDLLITVYAPADNPDQELFLSVNGLPFEMVTPGNTILYENMPTPIRINVTLNP
jgi:hypothetical protein